MGFDTWLTRGPHHVELMTDCWVRALAMADDHGWTAALPRSWYLYSGVTVADPDARALAKAWQRLFDATHGRPDVNFPTGSQSVEHFAAVRDFVAGGELVIERGAPSEA